MTFALTVGLLAGPACTHATFRQVELSDPTTTEDGTVWWAETSMVDDRARSAVIMCKRGADPVCVRIEPAEGSARH